MNKNDMVQRIIELLLDDSKLDPFCQLRAHNTLQLRLQKLHNDKLKVILKEMEAQWESM